MLKRFAHISKSPSRLYFPNAFNTLSGVIGKLVMRTPARLSSKFIGMVFTQQRSAQLPKRCFPK
jgi:hypothetical protein